VGTSLALEISYHAKVRYGHLFSVASSNQYLAADNGKTAAFVTTGKGRYVKDESTSSAEYY